MRSSAHTLLHVIKDQVRMVRYSIREEAETPGSLLPRKVRDDMAPLVAIGSMFGTPALRLADGLFTQVEAIAVDVLMPSKGLHPQFPCPAPDLFSQDHSFADRLYEPLKDLSQRSGARKVLVSEAALGEAWTQIVARHGDTLPSATQDKPRAVSLEAGWVQVCAGIACALNDARPIRRIVFDAGCATNQRFMLAPNLYGAMVIGLAAAVVTRHPDLVHERDSVLESVESVVGARFDRFKRASSSKSPIDEVVAIFDGLLPFIP